MADTPEGLVKNWFYGEKSKKKIGQVEIYFPGAYICKPQGGMFTNIGVPDCLMCWMGIFVGIEIKAEYNTPTPPQVRHLRAIIAAGGVGAVLTGYDTNKLAAIRDAVLAKVAKNDA